MLPDPDLENLIELIAEGDKSALSRLYEATGGKLFALCIRIVKNRTLAEDTLRDAYLEIWHNAKSFDAEKHSALSWIVTTTRELAITYQRQLATGPRDLTEDSESTTLTSLADSQFSRAYEKLSNEQIIAIETAFVEGATYEELADGFDLELDEARALLRDGLAELGSVLRQ